MFSNEKDYKKIITGTFISIGTSLALSLILILVLSFILSFLKDPAPVIVPTGMGVLYLSSLTGGFLGSAFSKEHISSLISGIIMTLIILLCSSFFKKSASLSPVLAIIAYCSVFLTNYGGGLLTMGLSQKRPKRTKKHKRR